MTRFVTLLLAAAGLFSCSGGATSDALPTGGQAPVPPPPDGRTLITVKATDRGIAIDPRLFGTNVPAWINPQNLGNPRYREATKALGRTVLRMPGGSWSDAYSWYACEMGDSNGCYWTWAAKPTDFLEFAKATGNEAMWTVSMNATSKEAAALVAFFNGKVGDTTTIGVDIRGTDWKRVGDWAALRAQHGNPEPFPIKLWEIGNEIYGSKQATGGSLCASWGWEDTWTCDGTEYMQGKGSGRFHREGYLEMRAAMRRIDPTISVGAVGVPKPEDWTDWGKKVITLGGDNLDFYVIHHYAFYQTPKDAASILPTPQGVWQESIGKTNAAMDALGAKRRVPIAVTEYNLASFQELDNGQLMTRAANALFIADMIGQMAVNGVAMANQWNLSNGRAGNGTDYGLMDMGTVQRAPQYYALKLWTAFSGHLLPVTSPLDAKTTLAVYAARSADGSFHVMGINKTGSAIEARIALAGSTDSLRVSFDEVAAENLEATSVLFNNVATPSLDLSNAPRKALGSAAGFYDYKFEPYSITVLHFTR